jgi:predicted transglutaminase-like cysteine proteinase
VKERWAFPKEMGDSKFEDCDGITLWKMHELMKRGFPADPLLFTVCHTENGSGHAILCVSTDRGDFILDNRYNGVKSYDEIRRAGYKILFRSSVGGSLTHLWDRINER